MDERLKKIIEESSRIVFFGGAGVSTESGIPDFRSESGLYHAQKVYGYPPESLISHSFYKRHPNLFFKYYKENLVWKDAEPNDAHKALARLEEMGKLKAVVTQNIDGLHQKAGSKKVYELHGSVLRNYCENCGASYDVDYIMDERNCRGNENLGNAKSGNTKPGDAARDAAGDAAGDVRGSYIPVCKKCGGTVKPDVVLYEEPLDEGMIYGAVDAISKADTLIVGGTSLVVYPAAGLINYFRGKNLVLINKSKTGYDGRATLAIHDSIGKVMRID